MNKKQQQNLWFRVPLSLRRPYGPSENTIWSSERHFEESNKILISGLEETLPIYLRILPSSTL